MKTLLILTCARRAAPDPWAYIKEMIPQIEAEKAPIRHGIVCDGRYEGPRPPGWLVFEYDRAGAPPEADPPQAPGFTTQTKGLKGNKLPYWFLLEKGLQLGDELIALEDDLILSKNAVRRMASFLMPPELAWVQFFSPRVLAELDAYPGLWRPPLSSSLFLQAAKYSPWGLERLCRWKNEDNDFVMFAESDTSLALAARKLELMYGAHCPDLVQHRGEISEASPSDTLDPWRVSRCWGGPNFDALSLWLRDDLYR